MTRHQTPARPSFPSLVLRRRLLLLPGLLFSLLVAACEVNKPVMPSFDTSVQLPLGTERIEIRELVEDEDSLFIGEGGDLSFRLEGDPDTLQFDLDLEAAITAQDISQPLGVFSLPEPEILGEQFTLAELHDPVAEMAGEDVVVPGFDFEVQGGELSVDEIREATLDAGFLTVTVTNGLPVPVSGASAPDQLEFELLAADTGLPLLAVVFPLIPSAGSSQIVADLSGLALPGVLEIRLRGRSGGSGGLPVTVDPEAVLAVDLKISALVASRAIALVEAQFLQTTFATEVPEDYRISEAEIESGTLVVRLSNDLPLPCTAVLVWSEIFDRAGLAVTRTVDLAAASTDDCTIELAGCRIQAGADPLTALQAQVGLSSPGSAGTLVELEAAMGLRAQVQPGVLALSSVAGFIPRTGLELDPITETIEFPEHSEGFAFTSATLRLEVENASQVGAELDLAITGTAGGVHLQTLRISEWILPDLGGGAKTTVLILDETNSELIRLLNQRPDTFLLEGTIWTGGSDLAVTVRTGDRAIVDWDLDVPVEVVINGSVIETDPDELDIDEDLAGKIESHVLGAEVRAEVINHLPTGVQLHVLVGQDSDSIADSPLLQIGPLEIAAGTVDPVLGQVVAASTSSPGFVLDAGEARVFSLPDLVTLFRVTIPAGNGQAVRFMSSDFVEISGTIKLEIRIDEDL